MPTAGVTKAQLEQVVRAIRCTPIIDNHAHPLLKPEMLSRHPLMSIATEAHGEAIHASSTTLAHHRAVKQLAKVLDCGPTWESVVAAIEQKRFDAQEEWVGECLDGIETILIDDGLDNEDEVLEYSWHDSFTRSKCRRIVRIESIASEIIDRHGEAFDISQPLDDVFDNMLDEFDTQIRQAISDPDVVGFKSVICYRTGLGVPKVVDIAAARESFSDIVTNYATVGRFRRLQHVGLNDLFVHHTAVLIRDSKSRFKKPIQFHTGLGDNDITLNKSSPSHLQEFIRAYPTVPIVLLHASYPFTREAGYLASVYANVYADIGEVFPFVSRDGQEAVLRQILELCPWSKILWSTDGHWFPETYLLAILQIREVLETILCEYVRKGYISWRAAVNLTQDILFANSNRLYNLELDLVELPDAWASGAGSDAEGSRTDREIFEAFSRGRPPPDFVRISWTDLTAMPRMRLVPFRRFAGLLEAERPTDIGITKACLGLLQNDTPAPGVSATGEYRLHPDFSSLRLGPIPGHVSMYGEFRERDGARVPLCPRTQLVRAVELAAAQGVKFLVGFEIEFLLLERLGRSSEEDSARYATLTNDGHAWSLSRFFADPKVAKLLRDVVAELDTMGIYVEQVHAESAPGQFELILPPLPPVEAVDALLHTRDVIAALATAAGLKFTLHPKPFPQACGTAAHVHLSVSPITAAAMAAATTGVEDAPEAAAAAATVRPEVYEPFYAGVLRHLRAIAAFTYSNPASYERLVDSAWAGGRWVTWGTQNRETALRKIEGSHWELKCMDGLANPYLALAAVLLAGGRGVADREPLVWRDCEVDPAHLTDNDRAELGVRQMLPASLEQALAALREDEGLTEMLGPELVERYAAVKETELKMLDEMTPEERRRWIMERY